MANDWRITRTTFNSSSPRRVKDSAGHQVAPECAAPNLIDTTVLRDYFKTFTVLKLNNAENKKKNVHKLHITDIPGAVKIIQIRTNQTTKNMNNSRFNTVKYILSSYQLMLEGVRIAEPTYRGSKQV